MNSSNKKSYWYAPWYKRWFDSLKVKVDIEVIKVLLLSAILASIWF